MIRTDISSAIDDFLSALFAAIEPKLETAGQRRVFSEARKSVGDLQAEASGVGRSLAVCSWLDTAMAAGMPNETLGSLMRSFLVLSPYLSWYDRADVTGTGSANFPDGHGNAYIVGPEGLARHSSLWVGATLLAPQVRYPDHTHPPEELYLVLSDGEFCNAKSEWTRPGMGGLFHNPPGILHAMRSAETPLLAVWTLVPAE